MNRKIATLFLLIIFLLNGAGFFRVSQFMSNKSGHKYLQNQYRREDLVHVTINRGNSSLRAKGFKRIEKGEYQYKGHRYDVISRMHQGGKTTIFLLHDSFEEELLTFLDSFFRFQLPNRKRQVDSKLKYGILKQFLPAEKRIHEGFLRYRHQLKKVKKNWSPGPFQDILVPPPKTA